MSGQNEVKSENRKNYSRTSFQKDPESNKAKNPRQIQSFNEK